MEETKVILIVGVNNIDPDKEQEFNDFYDNIHIKEVLKTGFIKQATRYRSAPYQAAGPQVAYPKYITIYEFDSEESQQEYEANREKQKRGELPPLTSFPVPVEHVWRTAYVPISHASA